SPAALRALAVRHRFTIPETVVVLTPSGGRHLWLTGPPDVAVPNSASRLAPGIDDATHPRDLSEGQKLALVLAIQLSAAPRIVLLDEPTRGLDYRAKTALIGIVDALAAEGRAVVISTHDVEFAARAADRVVVMAEGDVVADGPTTEVIVSSPTFAPQTAKILAPLPYLTVRQVARELATADDEGTRP
uniref:AAA family ATPase n=1 Tax=Streptomyces recifensis TaxID=67355 RepID=UPI001122A28D